MTEAICHLLDGGGLMFLGGSAEGEGLILEGFKAEMPIGFGVCGCELADGHG